MKLADYLWIWGQDAGTHHAVGNNAWMLPGENRMGPVEGAEYLGIPNMCRIAMSNKPEPPFDDEMDKLSGMKKVAWSIIGDEGSKRNYDGCTDIDEVLKLAEKYDNLVGGVMDDFFCEKRRDTYTPEVLRGLADRLHEANLDLWSVIYEHQLDLPVEAQIEECDIVSFWTWKAENLRNLEENLAKLEGKVTDKQTLYAGCYFWDYGGKAPLSMELMEYQLEVYKKWLKEGRIQGIIFCSNCIADIGLETVEYTRKWIEDNKEI